MKLSVVIVTHRRGELLRACCESVLRSLPPGAEVIVIVNGLDRDSFDYVNRIGDTRFRAYMIAEEPRAAARNRAFEIARGKILYFLDDDVVVPPDLFNRALEHFEKDRTLGILGGPNLTPPDSSYAERLFGAVMTSVFAAPMIRHRYTAEGGPRRASEHDLILCNLAFRRSTLPSDLRFRSGLRSNEENLFLFECREQNIRALYDPALYVWHRRRSTLSKFFGQVRSYGYGRAQQSLWELKSCHPAFLLPAMACGFTLGAAFFPPCRTLFKILLPLHALLSLGGAFESRSLRREGLGAVLLAIPLTGMVHLAYGLGFWAGVFNPLKAVPEFEYDAASEKVPSP